MKISTAANWISFHFQCSFRAVSAHSKSPLKNQFPSNSILIYSIAFQCHSSAVSEQFQCSCTATFRAISPHFINSISEQFRPDSSAISEQIRSNSRAIQEQFQCHFRAIPTRFPPVKRRRNPPADPVQFQSSRSPIPEQFQSNTRATSNPATTHFIKSKFTSSRNPICSAVSEQ